MKAGLHRVWDSFVKGHFSLLLVTLLAMFFILPLIPAERSGIDRLFSGFGILVILSCMRAVIASRGTLIFILLLGSLNIVFSGIDVFDPLTHRSLVVAELSIRLIYYLLIFLIIMRYVLNRDPVTSDKICGAISAYLLIGIIWSLAYSLFFVMDPNSFSIPDAMLSSQARGYWTLYFSFVSLTTIGYGDVTPLSTAAQTYAYLEAACGQIYLTVLIARLVGLHIVHSNEAPRGS